MKIAFICIFKKFEKRIFFKFIFQKLNFGKLVKINFIFRFYLSIISSHQLFCVLFNATLFEDIDYTFFNRHVSSFLQEISTQEYNISSVFFQVFSNMRVFHKQRCLGHKFGPKTKQILYLSRINSAEYTATQSKPEEIIAFFRQKETPVSRVLA